MYYIALDASVYAMMVLVVFALPTCVGTIVSFLLNGVKSNIYCYRYRCYPRYLAHNDKRPALYT